MPQQDGSPGLRLIARLAMRGALHALLIAISRGESALAASGCLASEYTLDTRLNAAGRDRLLLARDMAYCPRQVEKAKDGTSRNSFEIELLGPPAAVFPQVAGTWI